jgi:hypothetical protein
VARDGSDVRHDDRGPEAERPPADGRDPLAVPTGTRELPDRDPRVPLQGRDRVYHLRESERRLLATVGTFRVVPAGDVTGTAAAPDAWSGDVRHLAQDGLLTRAQVVINHQPTTVLVLTDAGKDLLDRHQPGDEGERGQTYHAGLVKPRELAHDAQLYRLYRAEAARIGDEGGAVRRVVLDYELKRDYQRYLNRSDRPQDEGIEEARRTFAEAAELPIVDGQVQLPDLRIEYEDRDGQRHYRDVELVTEHYSRSQLAAKAAAGFRLYRAGGNSRRGGTPHDPQHLEWLT